jgi:hypothetical protein
METAMRDLDEVLRATTQDPPFLTMNDILSTAAEVVRRMRSTQPDRLRDWLWHNATMLVANQMLSRSVQALAARSDLPDRVAQAVAEWRTLPGDRPALREWLEGNRPLLLQAWFHASAPQWSGGEPATSDSVTALVVNAQLAAYNAHDMEAFLATYAEDAEVSTPRGTRRGHDALRAAYGPLFTEGSCRAEVVSRLVVGDSLVDLRVATGLAPQPVRILMAYRVAGATIAVTHTIAVEPQ